MSIKPIASVALPRTGIRVGRQAQIILLLAICVLPMALYLPFLSEPFERDEGVYATLAQGLLHGHLPYRDFFDHKPPLIYGWYSLSFLTFGENVQAPRIMAALVLSVTNFGIFQTARLLFSERIGMIAAGIFGASVGLAALQINANTEVFMLLPLVASLLAFVQGIRDGRARWFFLAGIAGGIAVMTKQVAVWNVMVLLLLALCLPRASAEPMLRRAGQALLLASGACLAVAVVALPFIIAGAGQDFLFANLQYNWLYALQVSAAGKLQGLAVGSLFFVIVAGPLVVGAVTGVALLVQRRNWGAAILLAAWVGACLLGVVSTGRFFAHYWVELLPALALPTGAAIGFGPSQIRRPRLQTAIAWLAGLAIIFSLLMNAQAYLSPSAAGKHDAKYPETQAQWDNASQELGRYLHEHTLPGQTIYVFGREAQIYFYSDREPAARFLYSQPFTLDSQAMSDTIRTLREVKPTYIVNSAQPPLYSGWEAGQPQDFVRLLAEDYEYVGEVAFAQVYRLKTDLRDDLFRQQFMGNVSGLAGIPTR
ncbi:MAG TPA: glycosyltransferase family 39 protein [Dehalococcoidia bacterium]|nr:glycosyltransferase family 39 protein [Dehalococcoidia bacterium]